MEKNIRVSFKTLEGKTKKIFVSRMELALISKIINVTIL